MTSLVTLFLATFGVAYTLAQMEGPFGLSILFRRLITWCFSILDKICTKGECFFVEFSPECPICCAFWAVWPVALLPGYILEPLAAFGAVTLLWVWLTSGSEEE